MDVKTKALNLKKEKVHKDIKKIIRIDVDGKPYKYIAKYSYISAQSYWQFRMSYSCMYTPDTYNVMISGKKPKESERLYSPIESLVIAECIELDPLNFVKYIKTPNTESENLKTAIVPLGSQIQSKTYLVTYEEWNNFRHIGKTTNDQMTKLSDPNSGDVAMCISSNNARSIAVTNNKDHLVVASAVNIGDKKFMLVTLIDRGTTKYVNFIKNEFNKTNKKESHE